MQIQQEALAGTLESSDLFIRISPAEGPLELIVKSEVEHQFGDQICEVIMDKLSRLGVKEGAVILVEDKGALDCVIEARIEAAIMRAAGVSQVNWKALS